MSENGENHPVPDWVRRMREDGVNVRIGTGESTEVSGEPCSGFRPPEDTDLPPVPDWVQRLRADGYNVRVGTLGPPGLPYEPEVDFSLPERPRRALWKRIAMVARKLFESPSVSRLRRRGAHAPVP